MSEYNLLDTQAIDQFLNKKGELMQRYNEIQKEYEKIVDELMKNWKGRGADAFKSDSEKVAKNLTGIGDILKTMCDTLTDCREVFEESDKVIGTNNRNAYQ